jgi:hypothetical protein
MAGRCRKSPHMADSGSLSLSCGTACCWGRFSERVLPDRINQDAHSRMCRVAGRYRKHHSRLGFVASVPVVLGDRGQRLYLGLDCRVAGFNPVVMKGLELFF